MEHEKQIEQAVNALNNLKINIERKAKTTDDDNNLSIFKLCI